MLVVGGRFYTRLVAGFTVGLVSTLHWNIFNELIGRTLTRLTGESNLARVLGIEYDVPLRLKFWVLNCVCKDSALISKKILSGVQ